MARNDLSDVFPDIAEDSPDAAQRLRVEFEEAIQALSRSPRMWALPRHIAHSELSLLKLLIVCGGQRLGGESDSDDQRRSWCARSCRLFCASMHH